MREALRTISRGPQRDLLIPSDPERNHFNSLRLFFALAVIWSHCFGIYYGSEANEPVSLLLAGAFNSGNIAVRAFFMISGFLITISFVRSQNWRSYLRKRVQRIYPGFIVCVLVCVFVVVPLFSEHVDFSAREVGKVLLYLPFLNAYFPASDVFATNRAPAVNGALWSILFEFWCYLGILALGLTGLLRKRALIVAAALAITAGEAVLDFYGKKPGFGFIDQFIGWPYRWFSIAPPFLVGMIAWLYRDSIIRSRTLAILALAALLGSSHVSTLLFDAIFPYFAGYLIFYVAFSPVRIPDAARWGDFSYGTYLYGFPIQQMLIPAALPFMLYVPAAFLLSLLAGVASWFIVERHFLKRRAARLHDARR
jgi:peptidoglycan/LPS O-acetylase OafA/YrhL